MKKAANILIHYLLAAGIATSLSFVSKAACVPAASCTPGTASDPLPGFGFGIFSVKMGNINQTGTGYAIGYQDYTCSDSTVLTAGNTVNISITTGGVSTFNENVRVWIDYNNDQVFNPVTELVFSSDNSKIHTGNFTVPLGAVISAPLRMRVSSDWTGASQTITPCTTPQYSQVEDFKVVIKAAVGPPVANFGVSKTLTCNGSISFYDSTQNVPTNWKWYFGDGDSSNYENPTHTYTAPGLYTVQLIASNTGGADTATKVNLVRFNDSIPASINCAPATGSYCCGYGIYSVSINTLKTPGLTNNLGQYQNYTCAYRTTLVAGVAYPIVINTNSSTPQDLYIWIDLNNDSTFENNELVFKSLNKTIQTGLLKIESGAVLNTPLRMRMSTDYTGNVLGPCTSPTYGQVNDFTVVVKANTLPPVANFGTSTALNACDSIVAFIDSSRNVIQSWLWDFGDGTSSTAQNPVHVYKARGTFNVSLTVTGPYGTSSLTKKSFVTNIGTIKAASCTPATSYPGQYSIGLTSFSLNTLQFNYSATDYQDLTCKYNTVLTMGKSYPFTLNCYSTYRQYVSVYIDYNNDGVFEVPETVFNSSGGYAYSGNITPPYTAVTNTPLRMRIGVDYSSLYACSSPYYGEFLDISIVVAPNQSPTVAFASVDTVTCTGNVSFSDLSGNYPTSWKWHFGDGDSSTLQNPVHQYAASGFYTVLLKACNSYGCNTLSKNNYINYQTAQQCIKAGIVETVSATNKVNIYPNPTDGLVTISPAAYTQLQVINSLGILTEQRNMVAGEPFTLDLSGLAKGIYLLQFQAAGLPAYFQKLIIR